jgi:molybdopterin/thiamine biosynthesis adenylyltransferase
MKAFFKSFLSTTLIASLCCATLVCTQAVLADDHDPGVGIDRCDIGCKDNDPDWSIIFGYYCQPVIGASCDTNLTGCETKTCSPHNSNQDCKCL